MTYGDYEPEDAWHPGDAPLELARNLARRIVLLDGLAEPVGTNPRPLLAAIGQRLAVARQRRRLTDRDRLRIAQLDADLDYTRSRL